jgi:toxin ParE1/3/4
VTEEVWEVGLSEAAGDDFEDILKWTEQQFGLLQAESYDETIADALAALRKGPELPGVRLREDVGAAIYTLHVARNRRRGRHLIIFRVHHSERLIDVLRILHEKMDIARHLPEGKEP